MKGLTFLYNPYNRGKRPKQFFAERADQIEKDKMIGEKSSKEKDEDEKDE